jgi:hypothetical protein
VFGFSLGQLAALKSCKVLTIQKARDIMRLGWKGIKENKLGCALAGTNLPDVKNSPLFLLAFWLAYPANILLSFIFHEQGNKHDLKSGPARTDYSMTRRVQLSCSRQMFLVFAAIRSLTCSPLKKDAI